MKLETNVDLTLYNGLSLSAKARYFALVDSIESLFEAVELSKSKKTPVHILGGGTNTIWGSKRIEKFVLKMELSGFEILSETRDFVTVKISAGENWDQCVKKSVEMGFSGIEALSAIPGTAGATPVQNIGAYGKEISQALISLSALDIETMRERVLKNSDCKFRYRDSIFKTTQGKRFIITSITVRLSKLPPPIPNYHIVQDFFLQRKNKNPTLSEIREAVVAIRASRLPDPSIVPNCGSFFKNPIIDRDLATNLCKRFPTMPRYPDKSGIKIPAGWLIEKAGLRGKTIGRFSTYPKNALVLTSPTKKAVIKDLEYAKNVIISQVKEKFGVELEIEPEIVK